MTTTQRMLFPPLSLFVLLLGSPSHSQEAEGDFTREFHTLPRAELSLSAAFAWADSDPIAGGIDTFTAAVAGDLGLTLTDVEVGVGPVSRLALQLGPLVDFAFVDFDVADTTFLNAGPKFAINFMTDSPVVPFVYVAGGLSYLRVSADALDEDEVGGFWQVGGGVRIFVTDSAAFVVGIRHQEALFSVDGIDLEIPTFALTIGISMFFGG